MRSRLRHLAACGVLSLSLVCTRPAWAAGDDGLQQIGTSMWVVSVAELTLVVGLLGVAAIGALAGGGSSGGSGELGLGLIATPLIMGIGAGYASMEDDWDPRIAGAMHQGLWTGSALGAWGVLLGHQLDEQSVWPGVATTLGLGLLGIAGGAALGGLLVDSEPEVYLVYAAPLASGVSLLGAYLFTSLAPQLQGEAALADWELATVLIAAASAPLLVAALGVGAISVLQLVE